MKNILKRILPSMAAIALVSTLAAQDMKNGFQLLENGEFKKAAMYFGDILKTYPDNKTANICYGRAVGLSGESQRALDLFESLLLQYPDDHEILLNIAEAHLWLKNPQSAMITYQQILEKDSTSFVALMGTANSLSMQQDYSKAYGMIQSALMIRPGNPQAEVSQKFIRLGLANKLASQDQQFEEAIDLVQLNLEHAPTDQESLKLLANIQLMSGNYEKANQTYLAVEDRLERSIGQSIALHLMGENEKAMTYALITVENGELTEEKRVKANTHYISALLWNNQLTKAREVADSLVIEYPDISEYVVSQAEVAMYEADYIDGYETYLSFLKNDSSSFKGNLGVADASHALGLDHKAYQFAQTTLDYHPGQSDAKRFIQNLDNQHSPTIRTAVGYGRSSDGSFFRSWTNEASMSVTPLVALSASYGEKQFGSLNDAMINQTKTIAFKVTGQLNKRLRIQTSYASMRLQFAEGASAVHRSDTDIMLSVRMSKSQTIMGGIQTEIQDFNRELLAQNLKTTHVVLKNSMTWKPSGLGWYSEVYRSFFTDGNRRNLLFTSLYKTFDSQPSLKSGINYLTMTFNDQKPDLYFSPTSYHQVELFGNTALSPKDFPFTISVDAAVGIQMMESQNQMSWRSKISIDKQKGRLQFNLSGGYSSIVATESNGFSFMNVSTSVKWQLSTKPIFRKAD